MNNADRIMAMTNEELAEFLSKVQSNFDEHCKSGEQYCRWVPEYDPAVNKGCKDCFKEWLEREVENG